MDKEYRRLLEELRKANDYKKKHTLTIREIQCKTTECYHSTHQIGKNVRLVPSIRKEQLNLGVSCMAGGAAGGSKPSGEQSGNQA